MMTARIVTCTDHRAQLGYRSQQEILRLDLVCDHRGRLQDFARSNGEVYLKCSISCGVKIIRTFIMVKFTLT